MQRFQMARRPTARKLGARLGCVPGLRNNRTKALLSWQVQSMPPQAPKASEAQFTTELLKWLKAYGWKTFHVRNSGAGGMTQVQGDRGFVDILAVRGNRWIAAELKVDKEGTVRGTPRPEQMAWLSALRVVGAETHIWRPEDWSQILVAIA